MKFLTLCIAFLSTTVIGAVAESHRVHFENRCKSGTPKLIQGPNVLSSGKDFTSNGPLASAIAYLDNGKCGFNGENCGTVELTLINPDPSKPGSGSSADISLIPPHKFSQAIGFRYTGGCTDGHDCNDANCHFAFRKPDDNFAQVACQKNDVGLTITFC
ncbi:hypothetical protein D9756_005601 [Leucocoprinus leucothites]|uniref:Glycopeptide n=1 Tax=Leucocoprinus leucothites TaxID=201217 RepID=A0A8H5D877_9AGAR|nr:hypothetical protein D9756_005601 [Leucoagaricus leucothites]